MAAAHVANSVRTAAQSAEKTRSLARGSEYAASSFRDGESASAQNGPLVSNWSCATYGPTRSRLREAVARYTEGSEDD